MAFTLTFVVMLGQGVQAKTKKITLNKTSLTMVVKDTYTLKIKGIPAQNCIGDFRTAFQKTCFIPVLFTESRRLQRCISRLLLPRLLHRYFMPEVTAWNV